MAAELIYKTTSPFALDWWANAEKERAAANELRKAYIEKMTAEFGPTPKSFYAYQGKPQEYYDNRRLMSRGAFIQGLASGYSEVPPVDSGWRLDSKDKYWAPKLATKAGKDRAKELAELKSYPLLRKLPEIGVPDYILTGNYSFSAGIEHDSGESALYVSWGSYECLRDVLMEQAKVPEVVWEEIPRSVWYARIEAKEKAETVVESM